MLTAHDPPAQRSASSASPAESQENHNSSSAFSHSQGHFQTSARMTRRSALPQTADMVNAAVTVEKCQKGISQHLDDSHDYVCLNFGSNLAAAMFVCNRGGNVVGCSFQFSRFSGIDFVAKKSSLTIGNGRKAR
jgi:hypothetical protein